MGKARVYGQSLTDHIRPKVTLMSYPLNAVGTVVSMWIGSRHNETIDPKALQDVYEASISTDPSEYDQAVVDKLKDMYSEYEDLPAKEIIESLFNEVVRANLPPLDSVYFTFQIDDASVAFREQLVRSRLPQNFWTQTSRTADLITMDVTMMDSVSAAGPEAEEIYRNTVSDIRNTYRVLTGMGVPSEDIRLMPSSMTHRIYWMVEYRTLKSSLRKRLSWIAQSSLWNPVVQGIMTSIRSVPSLKIFAESMKGVPSDVVIRDGEIVAHRYDIENEDRYYGRDTLPVDPLWIVYRVTQKNEVLSYPELKDPYQYLVMKYTYSQLWDDEVLDILGWDRDNVLKLGNYDPFIPSDAIDKFRHNYGM